MSSALEKHDVGSSGVALFPDGFMPFLPRDNGGFDEPESEKAVEAINEDWGWLLRLPPADFWAVVQSEESLSKCLDSYLRFKRRAFDSGSNSEQISRAASQMFQRLFLIILRLVTSEAGSGVPETSVQADIIYDNWILDIPKVLDVCVLYGVENQDLVKDFLQKLFFLQPKYLEDLAGVVPLLVENIQKLENRCWDSLPDTRLGHKTVLAGWPDALTYIQDVCVNLTLILELHPPCGTFLMKGGGQLLACLAHVHDYLLPDLAAALGNLTEDNISNSSADDIMHSARMTFVIIQRLSFIMLKQAYLRTDLDSGGQSLQVAEGRGEALMNATLAIAQLDDKNQHNTLLHQIHKKYDLGSLLRNMIEEGVLSIDDAQYEYLCMLMGYTKQPDRLHASEAGPSTSAPPEVYDTFLASCISRVREVLPDYDDKYIAACLKECGLDPTKVIQRLLDGSLSIEMDQEHEEWPSLPDGQPGPSEPIVESATSIFPTSFFPDTFGEGSTSENTIDSRSLSNVRQWAQVAVGISRPRINQKTAKVLNSLDNEMKDRVLQQADTMLEYEDEYDDSFDDLITMGADGLADAEGDDQLSVSQAVGRKYPETLREGSQPTHEKRNTFTKGGSGKKTFGKKLWLLNGRIYNYKKEGAREVQSQEEADRLIRTEAEEIHGLGAGGNKPVDVQHNDGNINPNHVSAGGHGTDHQGAHMQDGSSRGRGRGHGHGHGRGRSGDGGGGRGYGRKGQKKASIGNHNRKDKALRKMA